MAGSHNQPAAPDDVLFAAWRREGDEGARDKLIERYLPLARKLASRYVRSSEPFEDLVQVASVGLIKAVERFDPLQGTAFTAFAVPTILGELKRHFRDSCWAVQVGRRAQELARAVIGAQRELTAAGRAPTAIDIAEYTGFSIDEVLEGLQAALAYGAVSLDGPTSAPGSNGGASPSLADRIGAADVRLEQAADRASIGAAARELPELERRILYLRYGEDLSQREIAARVGISQMHVSRLLRRALGRLRDRMDGPEEIDPGRPVAA